MNVGLLYYDGNRSRSLVEKVTKAAIYYRYRYDRGWPDTCHVHPETLGINGSTRISVVEEDDTGQEQVEGCVIRVLASPSILRDHLWIGQKEQE